MNVLMEISRRLWTLAGDVDGARVAELRSTIAAATD
jgi:hypothetical protein